MCTCFAVYMFLWIPSLFEPSCGDDVSRHVLGHVFRQDRYCHDPRLAMYEGLPIRFGYCVLGGRNVVSIEGTVECDVGDCFFEHVAQSTFDGHYESVTKEQMQTAAVFVVQ